MDNHQKRLVGYISKIDSISGTNGPIFWLCSLSLITILSICNFVGCLIFFMASLAMHFHSNATQFWYQVTALSKDRIGKEMDAFIYNFDY
jgi:hypothetical protein